MSNILSGLNLAGPSAKRSAVRAKKAAVREIRRGHPWLWRDSIDSISGPARDGDLAVLFDDKRKFVAIGLFSAHDPIAVRVLQAGSQRTIDRDFFEERILEAIERRRPLIEDDAVSAYRLVHGENDYLPGLVVDQYDTSLVVRLDSSCWIPWLEMIVAILNDVSAPKRIVLRMSRRVEGVAGPGLFQGMVISGEAHDGPVAFLENDLEFLADLEYGQKTGHFLDQRDNRALVGSYSRSMRVLDVFCNTGGFSVNAAAGGAVSVCSVDISEHATRACSQHMEMNADRFADGCEHEVITGDAFAVLEDLRKRGEFFDVIIVDPPSFAPNQAAVSNARLAYRSLTRLAVELLADDGWYFQASCSARIPPEVFYDDLNWEFSELGLGVHNVIRTGQTLDHPIGFEFGHYLKAQLCQLDR